MSRESDDVQQVIITDIRMPFGSMVVFMVKWAIASIPALLLLGLLAAMGSLFAGLLGTLLQ